MRLLVFVIAALILASPAYAAIDILDADRATLEFTTSTEITFTQEQSDARVTEAEAMMSWYPRETYNQRAEEMETDGEVTDDAVIYEWTEPDFGTYPVRLTALISTNNDITPVTQRPEFPIEQLDSSLIPYTEPSEMIDHNAAIGRLASRLAEGKDDQYEVVFALADWVTTNIDYDLNTLTADAVYPSSWVLEERAGVCDEMTNLFISLNRALGIPARFVSGVAYTDLPQLETNWGAHGWAEVYFPDVGWIPFDVTYGEYGYVDAGHIKLKDSIDSKENSIEYRGTGRGFSMKAEPLSFEVERLGTSPREYEFVQASLEAYADEVQFGSYNKVTLTLKNLREYYVSTRVELGETRQLSHESPDQQNILLKPYEETTIDFLIKVDDDLDEGYTYTFPIAAYTKLTAPVETSFKATKTGRVLDKELLEAEDEPEEEATVEISCEAETPVREESEITCDFTGETSGTACIDKHCETITTPATVTSTYRQEEPGIYTVPVTFENGDARKTQYTTVHVLDEAAMTITNVTAPETLRYDERGELTFRLRQTSASAPKDATVTVVHDNFEQEWEAAVTDYSLVYGGDRLDAGMNEITINASWADAFGERHSTTETVTTRLVDLTFGQRMNLWLTSFSDWLRETLV